MRADQMYLALARTVASVAVSFSLVSHLTPIRLGALFFAVFAVLGFLMSGPLLAWVRDTQPRVSRPTALASALLLWVVGFALTYALPVPVAPHESAGEPIVVEVSALGASPKGGSNAEVWFAIEADGKRVPPDQIRHDAGWRVKDGMLTAAQAGTPARWIGRATSAQVVFISHPWSGRARVAANGQPQDVDLYKPSGSNTTRALRVIGDANPQLWMQYPERTALQRLVQLVDALLIAFAVYVLQLWFVCALRAPSSPAESLWCASVRYALPSWAVSASLLVVFWPGVMSNDSIGQWQMAATGITSDWHPVYHTLLLTAARKIWDTPGFVVMLQAGALGLSSGYLIAVTERVTRTSSALAHLASWGCALLPAIAFSSVTLWKDVPYAASVVAITAAAISLLFLQRPRLSRPVAFALSLAVLLVCVLFRHNGPPVALASLLIVFVLSRVNRNAIALLALSVAGIAMVLKGPMISALGVERSNVAFTLYAHHIAAHLEAGEAAPTKESGALFHQIVKTRSVWPYRCSVVDITIFNPEFDRSVAARASGELREAWLRMARENPGTELRHLACVSSLVWLMDESDQAPLYEAGASIYTTNGQVQWVQPGLDARPGSFAPESVGTVARWLEESRRFNLLWRPAAWLYLLLFAAWVAFRRMKDWRILLVAAPVIVHSAVLAVANVAQDARYQLPVFIVALATLPGLLRAGPDPGSATPARID